MAANTDDSKTASIIDPAVDDSRTASIVDLDIDSFVNSLEAALFTGFDVDIENKLLIPGNEPMTAGQSGEFKRGISNTQWILCCVGLYLAAFLYGE
jgi:hypothetical protein